MAGKRIKKTGYRVWTPDLPGSEKPNITRYNKFLFSKWKLDKDSIIIGHSSGALATLGFLQEAQESLVIDRAFLVAGFVGNLDWDALNDIASYKPDWVKVKKRRENIFFFILTMTLMCRLRKGNF